MYVNCLGWRRESKWVWVNRLQYFAELYNNRLYSPMQVGVVRSTYSEISNVWVYFGSEDVWYPFKLESVEHVLLEYIQGVSGEAICLLCGFSGLSIC